MSNDKSSPSTIAQRVNNDKAREERHTRELIQARQEGYHEGVKKGHQDLIDFLQEAYLGKSRPDRGSPAAKALLDLARAASSHFKGLEGRATSKRRRS